VAEVGLLSFQLAEIMDSLYTALSCVALAVGVSMWVHATYFRDEK